jgi:hypothetical protein
MYGYYTAAVTAGSAVTPGGGGGATTPIVNQTASADVLNAYLNASGCDCSSALQAATLAFQQAAGIKPQDGYYGNGTRKALQAVLTSEGQGQTAPAACYTPKGPCYPGGKQPPAPTPTPGGCASGTVSDLTTGKCVAPCADGSSPSNGVCGGGVQPPSVGGAQAGNGPLLAGVLIVLLGGGAVAYATSRKKGHGRKRASSRRR